ncbi:polysaccharide deacetylase family protein [Actinoplanes sp. G11-F43]|uniref:polysaccharide deacetylase family protein n=1 Tax=Actinoplanes sp. G11-F43 TaxID=3424130 RepID=UPI003D326330
MPPNAPLSPAPTSRDDSPGGGRHRSTDQTVRISGLRTAFVDPSGATVPAPRHRAGAEGASYGSTRSLPSSSRSRGNTGRHTLERPRGGVPLPRTSGGAHRAPADPNAGGWMRAAKRRPQLALAGLVAVGLLLTAVPIPRGGEESSSVMTAAAEAVGVISKPEKKKPEQPQRESEPDPVKALPAVTGPAPAEPEKPAATPTPERTEEKAEQSVVPVGDGPFNSLRTTGSKTVMLSFDDGPDPNETPKVLDLLEKHQVKAVFCLVGTQARRHPDLVRRIAEEGHTLCNHTWSHDLKIGKKKKDQILDDLQRTNAAIRAAVPDVAIPYFRAPGGNFTDRLVKTAYGDGMTSLYWEVDPRDWEHLEGESSEQHIKRIVNQVRKETRPGAIVLSHDFNQPDTTKAYAQLLPWLVENFEVGVPGQETTPGPEPSESAPTGPATPSEAPSATPSASGTA